MSEVYRSGQKAPVSGLYRSGGRTIALTRGQRFPPGAGWELIQAAMTADPRSIEAMHLVLTVRPLETMSGKDLAGWQQWAGRTLVQLSGRHGVLARDTADQFYRPREGRDEAPGTNV